MMSCREIMAKNCRIKKNGQHFLLMYFRRWWCKSSGCRDGVWSVQLAGGKATVCERCVERQLMTRTREHIALSERTFLCVSCFMGRCMMMGCDKNLECCLPLSKLILCGCERCVVIIPDNMQKSIMSGSGGKRNGEEVMAGITGWIC